MIKVRPQALEFKDAVNFWESKIRLSPSAYARLSDEAKMKAFAVAGIAKGAELETVYNALHQAVKGDIGFEEFKKAGAEIFERRGWTGVKAWRVDNIFRTNVQGAYMAGRWKQAKTASDLRPYGQYSAVMDDRTRPTHTAVHGETYPLDHPFWDVWWPLNGFFCRCNVKTLSARQVKKLGIKVRTEDITGKLIEPVDPKTGKKLPARLLMPDPGFMYHPGKSAFGGMAAAATLKDPKPVDGLKGPEHYNRVKLKDLSDRRVPNIDESRLLPAGKEDAFYIESFKSLYGTEKLVKDIVGDPVIISLRAFQADKTPGQQTYKFLKKGHGESIRLLEDMIRHPYEIWLTPQQDASGLVRITKRYICVWKTADKKRIGGFCVFEVYKGVLQGVTSFLPKRKQNMDFRYLEKQRKGVLIYGRKGQ